MGMQGEEMNESNVVKLAPLAINQEAIDLVEDVLARLRCGESLAVGIVEVRRGRTVATAFSFADCYHETNSGAARLAARLAID